MDIVFLGLSITSSWGNGHATTYRGLLRELARDGHRVTFLERDVPWYAMHRDLPEPPYGSTHLYASLDDLRVRFAGLVARADAVIVGSYVPDGQQVGDWVLQTATGVTAFYDVDTPVTLAKLEQAITPTSRHARFRATTPIFRSPVARRSTGCGPITAPVTPTRSIARSIPRPIFRSPRHAAGTSATSARTATTASRAWTRC